MAVDLVRVSDEVGVGHRRELGGVEQNGRQRVARFEILVPASRFELLTPRV